MALEVILGAIAVAAALPLLLFGLSSSDQSRRDAVRRNLAGDATALDERQRLLQQSAMQRAVRPAIRVLAGRARRLTPAAWMEGLDRRLRLVGSPPRWPVERVLALKVILGILGLVGAVYFLSGDINVMTILIAIFLGLGGYFVPDAILWGRARERQMLIATELPDTIDQITICVEAGLGFDAALQRIAATRGGPLSQELGRTLNEMKLGAPRQRAFRNLIDRTDVAELRHFVYAIRQAEEFGLPVANVLRIQSRELRIKRRQRAEERALKMPVKIVFPLVTCIFPSLFIVLLGPAVMRIGEAF